MKSVKLSFPLSALDCRPDGFSNSAIRQPFRSLPIPIQRSIFSRKGVTVRQKQFSVAQSQASIESPVQEYRYSFGLNVRQSAAVLFHSQGRRGTLWVRLPHSASVKGNFSSK
jgi:hypothetical protein